MLGILPKVTIYGSMSIMSSQHRSAAGGSPPTPSSDHEIKATGRKYPSGPCMYLRPGIEAKV